MSNTERNRKSIQDIIEHVTTGRVLEAFEKYYDETVVMSENGDPEQTRTGKEANRGYETYFVENAVWHGVKVGPVLADGDVTSYEMWMDFTIDGQRVTRTQWAVQHWTDKGLVAKEAFFYGS